MLTTSPHCLLDPIIIINMGSIMVVLQEEVQLDTLQLEILAVGRSMQIVVKEEVIAVVHILHLPRGEDHHHIQVVV